VKARLTKNGASTQLIIPKSICERYGFRSGYDILMEEQENGLLLKPECNKPVINSNVWTIGYEGRTIEGFVHELGKIGIKQLIDVREIPISRKKGFSKTALKSNLEKVGINYIHLPKLGSPSDIRNIYKEGGSMSEFMDKYSKYFHTQIDSYNQLKGYAFVSPSVIMCMERAPKGCHRRIIAEELKQEGFNITHL